MSDDLASRKLRELNHKAHALDAELIEWQNRSDEVHDPFARHHSQIRRVIKLLAPLRAMIGERIDTGATKNRTLANCRAAEQAMLALHRIWEFFRAKYAQRNEPLYKEFLDIADEFAWECYAPVRKHALSDPGDERFKEPPLVFFNGGLSPFAVARGRAFRVEDVPGEALSGPLLQSIISSLPVPVVGVPYFQVKHLPDALVIGHEVGHLIAEDFKLMEPLKSILGQSGIDETHRVAWESWLSEIFADLYGCLCSGPAFVGSLIDFLLAERSRIVADTRNEGDWGAYPTDYLRVLFNLEALTLLDFDEERQAIEALWRATYSEHAMTAYEQDIPRIVHALLNEPIPPLKNGSLKKIINFSRAQHNDALQTVAQASAKSEITSSEIRPLFAAIRLLFEQAPEEFASTFPYLTKRINKVLTPQLRASEPPLSEEEEARRAETDMRTGEKLAARVMDLL